jgi:Holliday junction resolvasome RuvABC endonuclease subunit
MSAIHQPGPTSRIILGIDPGVAIVGYAVTGYGAARKEQVGEMVRLLLHLTAIPRPDDAADAAAIAICHAHTVRYAQEEPNNGVVRRKR